MKIIFVLSSLFVAVSTSFGMMTPKLVRIVASCATSDAKYRVSVQDNQGIGFHRQSHFGGIVQDENGSVVASYTLKHVRQVISPISGRSAYLDVQTNGKAFLIAGPSAHSRHFILKVVPNVSAKSAAAIQDQNLQCSTYPTE